MATKTQRIRIIVLFVLLELGFLAVLVQLFRIQVLRSVDPGVPEIWRKVQRGKIYGRRHYELAINEERISVYADPTRFSETQRVQAARSLAPLLQMEQAAILERLSQKSRFVWLKRKLSYALLEPLKQVVKEHRLKGIYFRREQKRVYPNGDLVPHVVGFANFDNKGIDGVERSYDQWMMARGQRVFVRHDAYSRPTDPRGIPINRSELSNSVVLTIDEMIQHVADAALTEACQKWNARAGSAIVMNPKTGEVLAMANYPSLDLNEYGQAQEFSKRNRAIWFTYEPGSGFKAFTMAAALSEGVVRPDTPINCENGVYDYHGHTLHDTRPSGVISATEVLVRSSNIGIAKISERLGIQRLGRYVEAFGFGQATGIDLPFERTGDVSALKRWGDDAAGYIGFGHGITVTPLQMLNAMNVIANGGLLMKPYVVQEVRNAEGEIIQRTKPTVVRRVLSPKVAAQVREMLIQTVEEEPGHEADVPGFVVAGKTGTAQKAKAGGYSNEDFVSSFIGFLPARDPQISIIVVLDDPQGEHLARKVAAPVFHQIATRTMEILTANAQFAYSFGGVELERPVE